MHLCTYFNHVFNVRKKKPSDLGQTAHCQVFMQKCTQGCIKKNLWDIFASVLKLETDRKLQASSQSNWQSRSNALVCVCVCVRILHHSLWWGWAVSSLSMSLTVTPTLPLPLSTFSPPLHQLWIKLCELQMLPLLNVILTSPTLTTGQLLCRGRTMTPYTKCTRQLPIKDMWCTEHLHRACTHTLTGAHTHCQHGEEGRGRMERHHTVNIY